MNWIDFDGDVFSEETELEIEDDFYDYLISVDREIEELKEKEERGALEEICALLERALYDGKLKMNKLTQLMNGQLHPSIVCSYNYLKMIVAWRHGCEEYNDALENLYQNVLYALVGSRCNETAWHEDVDINDYIHSMVNSSFYIGEDGIDADRQPEWALLRKSILFETNSRCISWCNFDVVEKIRDGFISDVMNALLSEERIQEEQVKHKEIYVSFLEKDKLLSCTTKRNCEDKVQNAESCVLLYISLETDKDCIKVLMLSCIQPRKLFCPREIDFDLLYQSEYNDEIVEAIIKNEFAFRSLREDDVEGRLVKLKTEENYLHYLSLLCGTDEEDFAAALIRMEEMKQHQRRELENRLNMIQGMDRVNESKKIAIHVIKLEYASYTGGGSGFNLYINLENKTTKPLNIKIEECSVFSNGRQYVADYNYTGYVFTFGVLYPNAVKTIGKIWITDKWENNRLVENDYLTIRLSGIEGTTELYYKFNYNGVFWELANYFEV